MFCNLSLLGHLAAKISMTASMSIGMSLWTNRRSRAFSLSSFILLLLSVLTNFNAELALSTVALLTGASWVTLRIVLILMKLSLERLASDRISLILSGFFILSFAEVVDD